MQAISRNLTIILLPLLLTIQLVTMAQTASPQTIVKTGHAFNGPYRGDYIQQIAFPIGGMGAGMFCLEGTGSISHMSVRNTPDMFNEPPMFAAIAIKGKPGSARVLEGP